MQQAIRGKKLGTSTENLKISLIKGKQSKQKQIINYLILVRQSSWISKGEQQNRTNQGSRTQFMPGGDLCVKSLLTSFWFC